MAQKTQKIFKLAFALLVLFMIGFGTMRVLGASNRDWAIGAAILYLLPLILVWFKKPSLRTTGAWLGIFLILEFVYSVFIYNSNFITMTPNTDHRLEVVGDVMPGFSGIQHITTDKLGFRVTKPVDYFNKPENTYRIFAIGASTTAQVHLGDRKTWTHLLQTKMDGQMDGRNVEVVNTGLPGLRAEHNVATLERISAFQPDLVVFLLGINDWNRQIRHALTPGLARKDYLDQFNPKRSLIGIGINAARAALRKPKEKQQDGEIEKADGHHYAKYNHSFERRKYIEFLPKTVATNYDAALNQMMKTCENASFECVFLTQPTGYSAEAEQDIIDRFWMTPPNETYTVGMEGVINISKLYNRHLLEKSKKYNQQTCDIASMVPPITKYMYDDCHYNEEGARLIADLLFDCLRK